MSNGLLTLTDKLATRLDMGEGNGRELFAVLKATAFKGDPSDAQMTALLVVANQYGLNPWTKEIYAFPDRQNGIVPVVGVDGWSRIINDHPQFDGMEYRQDDESCTCIIYRKDRKHPVSVTEWMSECRRDTGPWKSHPKRMLRHKATIQCARLAFGYSGIYDQDEAERIREVDMGSAVVVGTAVDLEKAMADIAGCESREALVSVWQRLAAECNAAKDKAAYDAIKDAVAAKGQEFATAEQAQ